MTTETTKHIVVFPAHMWGHTRTMCTLVARIVKLQPVTVTFFTVPSIYDRIQAEIGRDFLPEDQHLLSRIRVISVPQSTVAHDTTASEASFAEAWGQIINDAPIVCVKTGTQFEPHPVRPTAVVVDVFHNKSFDAVKRLGPETVKVYVWLPSSSLVIGRLSRGNPEPLIRAEAERRGLPFDVVAGQMFSGATGRVVEDGINPPMHDYENQPQQTVVPIEFITGTLMKAAGIVQKANGLLTFDAADYAPKAVSALRSLFAKTGRKAYYTGPLIPRTEEDTSKDPRSVKIQKFLDDKLVSHGEKSVVYISFGSLFWPSDNAKLWAVLDVLMEKNIPFVMSCAAAFSTHPPAEIQEKMAQYGHAVMTNWVPQQALLEHLATGWYISHGGHNSTLETINAGIPLILWPVAADQPVNAIHLAETLDVAYELIEVRHGTGLGKIYRNGRTPIGTIDAVMAEAREILDLAFGEDGARKRANILKLRDTLRAAWAENGVAQREVESFVNDI
ncbi:UDP-Glycosyltransferase/glycogen phosphorylase [Fomes fomentarius]|nr:UDP-Glycosyltransferase/glycogen phosphorylase [Fomes fomentarius]